MKLSTFSQPEEAAETRLNGLLALYAAAKGSKAKFATLLQVRSLQLVLLLTQGTARLG